MSALISGVLKDGMGKPIPNCTIELKAERTSATVITKTIASQKPEENGSYSMNVEAGKYSVTLCVEGYPPNHVGEIYVHSESVPGTLNYYLGLPTEGDLPPATIQQFEEMVARVSKQAAQVEKDKTAAAQSAADALASKNTAKTSETNAGESADGAAASAQAAKLSETNADSSKQAAQASAAEALASQNAANSSKKAAEQSSAKALVSENAAKTSESNAGKSADGAAASAQAAKLSETNADSSKQAAQASAAEALASQNAAKASETKTATGVNAAAESAKAAKASETNADSSKKSAQTSAKEALASQNAAKASETNAMNSEKAASDSADNAKFEADRATAATEGKQDKSELLAAIAALTTAADQIITLTGKDAVETAALSSFAKALLAKTDADGVREYLGLNDVASSGENSDITHITGLTTPLSLKQGGTGAIDAAKAKSNLGLGSTDVVTFGHMNLERYDDSNVSASGILNLMNYNTDGSVRKARARIYEEIRQDGKHWLTLHLQVGDTNQYWGFQDNGNFNSPKGISTNWMKTTSDGEGYVNINSGPNQSNYIVGKASDGSNIWYAGKGSASNNNVQVRNYVGDCSLGALENGNVELLTKGNKGEIGFTGFSTKLYSASSGRNWRNQITGTPSKDCYNRFWGQASRPCVYEVGFDSTYCTYTQINADGSIVFNVNGNVTCKTLTQTSDIALKDNIVAIDNALDKISQLNGYTFTWKDSGLPSAGVIAQEVMEVLPEIISTTRDEAGSNSPSNEGDATFEQTDEGSRHYAVEYSGLIGLLIAGINEERQNRELIEKEFAEFKEHLKRLQTVVNQPIAK